MANLTRIATSGLAAATLGLVVAACQPPAMAPPAEDGTAPPAEEATASAGVLTVAQVESLVTGKTIVIRDDANKVSAGGVFRARWNRENEGETGCVRRHDVQLRWHILFQRCRENSVRTTPAYRSARKEHCDHVDLSRRWGVRAGWWKRLRAGPRRRAARRVVAVRQARLSAPTASRRRQTQCLVGRTDPGLSNRPVP